MPPATTGTVIASTICGEQRRRWRVGDTLPT
jgi:hypothetical protein